MFIIYTRTSLFPSVPRTRTHTNAIRLAAPLHTVFGGTYLLSPLYWLIPVAFGCVLLAWSTARVYITRRALSASSVKPVEGLQMCTSPSSPSLPPDLLL